MFHCQAKTKVDVSLLCYDKSKCFIVMLDKSKCFIVRLRQKVDASLLGYGKSRVWSTFTNNDQFFESCANDLSRSVLN